MLIFERIDHDGRAVATHLSRQGNQLLLSVGDERAEVPARVIEAIMRRYGRELDPEIALDGESLVLGDGLALQRFRFHARVDAEGRDHLALVESGAPPLAVMATTVAGALEHLLAVR